MSRLRHGFFRVGFMLCDRCALNTRCESFSPGGECAPEREAYDWLVGELTRQYGLEGLADQIFVRRAVMYLIRIARAETYESTVGVTEKSALLGAYISRLDNALRAFLNDLAVTRSRRGKMDKAEAIMVDVEKLLETLAGRSAEREKRTEIRELTAAHRRMFRIRSATVYLRLLDDWRTEKTKLSRSRGRLNQ